LKSSSREVEGTARGNLGNHDQESQVLIPADPRYEGVLEDEVKLPGGTGASQKREAFLLLTYVTPLAGKDDL
jgi:hypothetical protein